MDLKNRTGRRGLDSYSSEYVPDLDFCADGNNPSSGRNFLTSLATVSFQEGFSFMKLVISSLNTGNTTSF
jgi:hypothetical protein